MIKCLTFNRAFDTVSHKMLTDRLLMYGLDEQTVRWLKPG